MALALLPVGLALCFAGYYRVIGSDGTVVVRHPWVPSLGVSLSFYVDGLSLLFALLALRGDYPVAAYIANRMRPPDAEPVPEQRLDFIRFRWGDAPAWWEQRDELPAWHALRGNGHVTD